MTAEQWLRVLQIARSDAAKARKNHGLVVRPLSEITSKATPSERTARARGRGS